MRTRLVTSCICQDTGHLMEFILDDYPGDDVELYLSVQLNPRHGVLRRCWIAIGYVLGKRSRFGFGHWDSGGLSPESAWELRNLLDKFIASAPVTLDMTISSGTTLVR